jgi:hypothetical protein
VPNTFSQSVSGAGVQLYGGVFDSNGTSGALDNLALASSIALQATGTFGGGTIALTGSNDGTNFYALPTAVTRTTPGLAAAAANGLGFRYYRLELTGATGPALTVSVVGTKRHTVRE